MKKCCFVTPSIVDYSAITAFHVETTDDDLTSRFILLIGQIVVFEVVLSICYCCCCSCHRICCCTCCCV